MMDKPAIVIEVKKEEDSKEYVYRTAAAVITAKKKRADAKEALETALASDPAYQDAVEAQIEARDSKKEARAKIIVTPRIAALQAEYKDASTDLKDAVDSLDGALEVHCQKTGDFKVQAPDGTTLVVKRKFSLGSKQLSFFE